MGRQNVFANNEVVTAK